MYFPRNWKFGPALSKLRNFGAHMVQDEKAFGGRGCEFLAEVLLQHAVTAVASVTFREMCWNYKWP
jgi:hypothetical protein